jgi:hypothetical protein
MRLRMLTGIAGERFSVAPGEETERFSGDEATRLVAAGYAVPVSDEIVERAVKAIAPERRKGKS